MSIKINLKIFGVLLILFIFGFSRTYLIFFLFTLIHELGHLFCGLIFGLKPKNIKLMPMGLSICFSEKVITWKKKIIICIAGPAVNFFISLCLMIYDKSLAEYIYANLIIGIFNLIPIIPLDGGKIIKIIFDQLCTNQNSLKYIKIISNITLGILSFIGIIGTVYLNNFFIPIIIGYLWVISFNEIKKARIENTVKTLINTKNIVDKKVI